MTQQTANSNAINNSARCQHFYPNGRRCRLFATTHPNFCSTHARLPQNQPEPEIASTLTANLNDFTSAVQINNFLSRLLLLLAQDKISTRRAAVLAYITNQLLRTLPAIAKEDGPENCKLIYCQGDYCQSHDVELPANSILVDMPRPVRDPVVPQPSNTPPDSTQAACEGLRK